LGPKLTRLLRFPSAIARDPAVDAWFEHRAELGKLAKPWFERMRKCGADVCEPKPAKYWKCVCASAAA